MIRIIVAVLALVCVASNAEARQRHTPNVQCVETGSVMFPVCGMVQPFSGARSISVAMHKEQSAPRSQRARQVMAIANPVQSFNSEISKPARYIGGRLICAINVGAALAERGIKGTGSAAALSYLHWGRSAGGPVPGAAIVSRIQNGVVYAWNATGGQSGWREIPYRHHVLDYRVAG